MVHAKRENDLTFVCPATHVCMSSLCLAYVLNFSFCIPDLRVFVILLDSFSQCHGPTASTRPRHDLFQHPLQRVTVLDNERPQTPATHADPIHHTVWPIWEKEKETEMKNEREETLYRSTPNDPLTLSNLYTNTILIRGNTQAHKADASSCHAMKCF